MKSEQTIYVGEPEFLVKARCDESSSGGTVERYFKTAEEAINVRDDLKKLGYDISEAYETRKLG